MRPEMIPMSDYEALRKISAARIEQLEAESGALEAECAKLSGELSTARLRNQQLEALLRRARQWDMLDEAEADRLCADIDAVLAGKKTKTTEAHISDNAALRVAELAKLLQEVINLPLLSHDSINLKYRIKALLAGGKNAAPQAAVTLATAYPPESDPAAGVSGGPAVAAPDKHGELKKLLREVDGMLNQHCRFISLELRSRLAAWLA